MLARIQHNTDGHAAAAGVVKRLRNHPVGEGVGSEIDRAGTLRGDWPVGESLAMRAMPQWQFCQKHSGRGEGHGR